GRGHVQQGRGGGGGGDRDGGGDRAADAAARAEDVSRMARSRKDPRHRAREAALQILYQWEIGARKVENAADTFFTRQWPDEDEPPDELRSFATRLAVDTVDRLAEIDPLIAETAKRWRPERMAVLDRMILGVA